MTAGSSEVRRAPVAEIQRLMHVVFPFACVSYGIASVGLELCDAIAADAELGRALMLRHWVATAMPSERRAWQDRANLLLERLLRRWVNTENWLRGRVVRRLTEGVKDRDLVLLYPGLRPHEIVALRARGAQIVHDFVNTAFPYHWRAMRRAYEASGIVHRDPGLEERQIAEERQRVLPGDLGFVCSPQVRASFEEFGLPSGDLISTTCGWNPRRWRIDRRGGTGHTFLFVASGSVRKGLPMLLKAWRRAGIDGRLIVVGDIDSEVAEHCGADLRCRGVETRPFSVHLTNSYCESDVFVLPSFEEGSPLVGFLALGAGMPCIVSPMAAGWVMRHEREALVVEPDDVDGLAAAMCRVTEDPELRHRLGENARRRANDFTWERVAVRRFTALLERLRAT